MFHIRWAVIILLAILATLPLFAGAFSITLMNHVGLGALVALGLVLLTGIGGMISFGQASFVGIAAYATGWASTALGWSPWAGLAFGLVLTGLAAALIGAVTLRLGGHFLPLSTIAWAISIYYLFGNLDILGGHTGLMGVLPITIGSFAFLTSASMHYLIWVAVLGASWFSYNLLDSREGRAVRLLRGGPYLMSSAGMNTFRTRLVVFVIAALFAGIAGWLYAHMTRFVSPKPFDVTMSIEYLLMAIVGGASQILGAGLGAALVTFAKNWLQDIFPLLSANPAHLEQIVFSLLMILMLQYARGGLSTVVQKLFRGEPAIVDLTAPHLPRRAQPVVGTPLLVVEQADRRFGGVHAVNQVSFEVRAGEIAALIGPNGAGKSTMFNLITGTIPLSSGRIRFLGRDITTMSQRAIAALGCARTFQHVKLRPQMTLLDNVASGTYLRTRSGYLRSGLRLNRAEEAQVRLEAYRRLEQVGLAERAHHLAGDLPLGQQRILEIARALAADPVLLVLDEPAAGLRKKEKEALAATLRELRAGGLTILIVEHDMDFVMNLVDKVVVMVFGSKICEGEPSDVRRNRDVQDAYLGGAAA